MPSLEEHCSKCRRLADTYNTPLGRMCDQCIGAHHHLFGRCEHCGTVKLPHLMSDTRERTCRACQLRYFNDLILVCELNRALALQCSANKGHSYWIGPYSATPDEIRALIEERQPARVITDDPLFVALGFYTKTPVVIIRNGEVIEAGLHIGQSDVVLWLGDTEETVWVS